jgi:hypothetical protein
MTTPKEDYELGETVWTMKVDELLKEIEEIKKEMNVNDNTSEG